jgi:hypothetical protein
MLARELRAGSRLTLDDVPTHRELDDAMARSMDESPEPFATRAREEGDLAAPGRAADEAGDPAAALPARSGGTGRLDAEERALLERTRKPSNELSAEELSGELRIVERRFAEDPDLTEIDLGNGHSWRRDASGQLCRHSNGELCVPSWRQVERRAIQENLAYWRGRETDTTFARHQQSFNSLVATLRNKQRALAAAGRGHLLPALDESVLNLPVDVFIQGNPTLRARFNRLSRADRRAFLEGGGRRAGAEMGARTVGGRNPDIVEFFLDEGDIVVTDITTATTPGHVFKTEFYREVMRSIVGGQGPRVSALDLNLATRPPTSVVVP